jgi:hypothetical protein
MEDDDDDYLTSPRAISVGAKLFTSSHFLPCALAELHFVQHFSYVPPRSSNYLSFIHAALGLN